MGKFFDKNKDNPAPEDFVLMSDDNSDSDNPATIQEPQTQQLDPIDASETQAESDDVSDFDTEYETTSDDEQDTDSVLEDTALINVAEVSRSLDKKKKFNKMTLIEYIKTHRTTTIAVCAVLIAAITAAAAIGIVTSANPLRNYVRAAAEKQNVMYTIDLGGTLNSGEKYEIMSLVSGTVAESKYEVGDEVNAGDTLYQLDDTEAKLAVERAKNELNKAKDTTSSSASADTGRIIASDKGTIATLNIKQGSSVTAGSQVGSIKKDDGATVPIISYVSGTISIVSAQQGRSVSNGQLIASVKLTSSASSSKSNSEYDKKTGEIDVQAAQKQLENYTIKSPISGVIIEKNTKQGDNVGAGNSYKPMMVVMDTSKLSLTVSVGDDVIKDVKKGQSVTITTDSISDSTFSGEVTSVGAEGKAGENGKINFDVTVTISEPGDLKSGMNVKAKVILSSVKNVVTVPQSALLRTDGQNALVLVVSNDNGEDKDLSETTENSLNNPDIKVPKGCELKSVKYGISDGNNVQIISGIKVGDIVAYNPDEDNGQFIKANITNKESESSKSSSKSSDKKNTDDSQNDDAVKQEVKDKVNNLFGM